MYLYSLLHIKYQTKPPLQCKKHLGSKVCSAGDTSLLPGPMSGPAELKHPPEIALAQLMQMGVSENVVYPFLPNGFADHYPYEKWLFHWGYIRYTPFSDIAM